MGAVPTTVKHHLHVDAITTATMDVGAARVPRAGPKPEFREPQSRADTKLEVGVGFAGES